LVDYTCLVDKYFHFTQNSKLKTSVSLESLLPDTSRLTADLATQFVIENPETFRDMLDTSLAQEYPMAMRASRVVYLVAIEAPDMVRPYLPEIVEKLPFLHDQSVIRNFLHVFDNFIHELSEDDLAVLLKLCFDFIEDLSQTIAIRTYSLKLLYFISQRIPEIKPELISIIHLHLPESDPGFYSQARKILQKLNREIIKPL
jgi:hypothetical protein